MPDLDGKIAFVTGAGSGLGREIALTFARAGARVAVNDLRAEAAAAVQEDLAVLGAALSCGPLVGDVSDSGRVRGWFETLGRTTGERLDVLVNNAGYADVDPETQARMRRQIEELTAGGPVVTALDATRRMTDERWARMLAVHLNGTFFCTREALGLMVPQRSGRIINMASIAGTTGIAGVTHYSAAKGGIVAFTKALAREVGPQGILVNAIAPGYIDTPLLDVMGDQRAMQTAMIALQTAVGRLGEAYRGEYRIHLAFNDGVENTVDFSEWLQGPVFEPLRDQGYFRRFFVEGGTVTWPNGADIAPETLHERAKSSVAA